MKTELDLAYLAGVVDSDGSLSIARDTWRIRNGKGHSPAFEEIVIIGMCDSEPIYLAKELFGGSVRAEKSRGPNRRPMFFWQATNKIAVAAVRSLLPYLRVKRRQADLLLALRAIKDRGRKVNWQPSGTPHGLAVRPEVVAEMESLARQVRELNDSRYPLALSE